MDNFIQYIKQIPNYLQFVSLPVRLACWWKIPGKKIQKEIRIVVVDYISVILTEEN